MGDRALINKEVIPYICAGKHVSKEYLADGLGFDLSKIERILDIDDSFLPTINQAKRIAKLLHIPFAGLYMNPKDIKISAIPAIKNYRSLGSGSVCDESKLNIAICDVLNERRFYIDICKELDQSLPRLSLPQCDGSPESYANCIRDHFSIDISKQYRFNSLRQFYLYLRNQIEDRGVFVQGFSGVPVETARGFSIYEQSLPVIGINDEDRTPAKSFTLIHELVHLMKRESSMCNDMINRVSTKKEEIFCNAVAGELLVPQKELVHSMESLNPEAGLDLLVIATIAKKFCVSREVVIRRLLDLGIIGVDDYDLYYNQINLELEQSKAEQKLLRESGKKLGYRNVSQEIINKTSSRICNILYHGYTEEYFSKRDIAAHLGIAQKHINKFLQEVVGWNN